MRSWSSPGRYPKPEQVLEQLSVTSQLEADAWFPKRRTGDGVEALIEHLASPPARPGSIGRHSPMCPTFWWRSWREQLLAVAVEELPHSIATE